METQNLAAAQQWDVRELVVQDIIYKTCAEQQQVRLETCTSGAEMWNRLQTEYADMAPENSTMLTGQFFGYKFSKG